MTMLYVANATNQNVVLPYQGNPMGQAGSNSCWNTFNVPAGTASAGQDVGAMAATITAAWAQYGINEWSGSGVGWSTSPITM